MFTNSLNLATISEKTQFYFNKLTSSKQTFQAIIDKKLSTAQYSYLKDCKHYLLLKPFIVITTTDDDCKLTNY